MKENERILNNQMLTATEAAKAKGMSLNRFKYHLAKGEGPEPYYFGVGKHKFYDRAELDAWSPNLQPQKRRKTK